MRVEEGSAGLVGLVAVVIPMLAEAGVTPLVIVVSGSKDAEG